MSTASLKFASRSIRPEFLAGLEVLENNVSTGRYYPLPGSLFQVSSRDPRLSTTVMSGVPEGDRRIAFYEAVATIRHTPTKTYYVVFRQTMDALLHEQQDVTKYPQWLMNDPVKETELKTFIHIVKPDGLKKVKQGLVATIDDWLDPIVDPDIFDALAYYCLRNGVFTEKMYGSLR